MSECPTCGKALNTKQGMRQHHTKVHGDPLPNLTCHGCGSRYHHTKADRSYCADCNPNAGENNPNWKDARETAQCKLCDATFEYYPSDKDGVYCSHCVESADGLLPESPDLRVDRVDTVCRHCDKSIKVLPSRMKSQTYGNFCDLQCYGKWLSEHIVGPNHHQWEGGSFPYGEGWWSVRRKALQRDDYTCQSCNKGREGMGRNPDVHHIIPVKEFEVPSDAHTLENVICLCRSCHRRVEEGLINLPRHPYLRCHPDIQDETLLYSVCCIHRRSPVV